MKEVIIYPVYDKEGWRPVAEFEEYFVSSFGRIIRTKTGRILKPVINHKGYLIVQLCKEGHRKNMRVHRLVAETFIPNPDNLPEVDHINGDRQDNRTENLRWVTGSANTRNREVCRQATSKYNGVRFHEKSGKFLASVWFNRKTVHLGTFTEETKAALAFNQFCKENCLNRELNLIEEVS